MPAYFQPAFLAHPSVSTPTPIELISSHSLNLGSVIDRRSSIFTVYSELGSFFAFYGILILALSFLARFCFLISCILFD